MPGSPTETLKPNRKKAAIAAVPAESPSMLSSRLNALVIPTTHRMVSGMAIADSVYVSIRTPPRIRRHAARICAISLTCGRRRRQSSISPVTNSSVPPASKPSRRRSTCARPTMTSIVEQ